MKALILAVTATALAASAGLAHAAPCAGLDKFDAKGPGTVPVFLSQIRAKDTGQAMAAAPDAGICDSLITVLGRLINGSRAGGRKLEEDKPLDHAQAQANLDEALQKAEVRAQLDDLKRNVADENIRILYEAAVLDAEGFYDARELLIERLRHNLGV